MIQLEGKRTLATSRCGLMIGNLDRSRHDVRSGRYALPFQGPGSVRVRARTECVYCTLDQHRGGMNLSDFTAASQRSSSRFFARARRCLLVTAFAEAIISNGLNRHETVNSSHSTQTKGESIASFCGLIKHGYFSVHTNGNSNYRSPIRLRWNHFKDWRCSPQTN